MLGPVWLSPLTLIAFVWIHLPPLLWEKLDAELNGWGFKRLHQSGNDYNAIYHECFLRGMPHLTNLMKRVEGNLGKMVPYIEGESVQVEVIEAEGGVEVEHISSRHEDTTHRESSDELRIQPL